jgi:hypothetical protein
MGLVGGGRDYGFCALREHRPNRDQQSVSAAGQSLDDAGSVRRIPHGLAQSVDRGIDTVVKLDEPAFGPESLAQLFAGHQFAGSLQQSRQNLKRLPGKLAGESVTPQFSRLEVGLKGAEGDGGRAVLILHNSASQTRLGEILDPDHPHRNSSNRVGEPRRLCDRTAVASRK